MLLPYREHQPLHGERADIADTAALIGRARAGHGLVLRGLATLRADGEAITIEAVARAASPKDPPL